MIASQVLLVGGIVLGVLALVVIGFMGAVRLGGRGVKATDPDSFTIRPQTEVGVERLANGDLRLTWVYDAEAVTVYAGTRPGTIAYDAPVAQVEGDNVLIITGRDPGQRFYFALAFTGGAMDGQTLFVAERFLPLEESHNFRDIGGYRNADGRHVRWGQVYRADSLDKLTDSDLAYLNDTGVAFICDLRDFARAEKKPDRVPESANWELMPIHGTSTFNDILPTVLFKRSQLGAVMAIQYMQNMITYPEAFGTVLTRFADPRNLPGVFHCTAGKDRAGLTAAFLLSILGVPEETIIADYSLSNVVFEARCCTMARDRRMQLLTSLGVSLDQIGGILIVDPAWLEDVLEYIKAEYGSAEAYLVEAGGMDADTIERLRANLLE